MPLLASITIHYTFAGTVLVRFSSVTQLYATPWAVAHQASLSSAPRMCSNSCPLSRWCQPTISSSVIPFSSCLQSFPKSGFFLMTHLFTSGGQSWNFSFSISPSNEYSGLISFGMDWFDLAVLGTLESSPISQFKSINSSVLSFLYSPTLISIHDYWKNRSFD